MNVIKEIKTTVVGLLLWLFMALYLALPYVSDKELWEVNNLYLVGLFICGLGLILAPDKFINIFFGWMKKKASLILLLITCTVYTAAAQTFELAGSGGGVYVVNSVPYNASSYEVNANASKITIRTIGENGSYMAGVVNMSYSKFKLSGVTYTSMSDLLSDLVSFSSTVGSFSGWADYVDTQYTVGSPFSLAEGVTATLPNNAATKRETQLPSDLTSMYDNAALKILGKNGDSYQITIEFKVKPDGVGADPRVTVAIDIGGAVGEIYRRDFYLSKGNGIEHYYLSSFNYYTLDTWEANGGLVKVTATNEDLFIYDIRYVITRTHKAR